MAIADSPATPAPTTKTRAGAMVPAAVVIKGKSFGRAWAAIRTARYPAMLAWELRTSIDCARVVRGRSSSEKRAAPREATAADTSGAASGAAIPTIAWPARSRARSGLAGSPPSTRTQATTSAPSASSRVPMTAPRSS